MLRTDASSLSSPSTATRSSAMLPRRRRVQQQRIRRAAPEVVVACHAEPLPARARAVRGRLFDHGQQRRAGIRARMAQRLGCRPAQGWLAQCFNERLCATGDGKAHHGEGFDHRPPGFGIGFTLQGSDQRRGCQRSPVGRSRPKLGPRSGVSPGLCRGAPQRKPALRSQRPGRSWPGHPAPRRVLLISGHNLGSKERNGLFTASPFASPMYVFV